MVPAFMFAMYEKDGLYLEQILMNFINVRFLHPPVRRYETENFYDEDTSKSKTETKRGGSRSEKK